MPTAHAGSAGSSRGSASGTGPPFLRSRQDPAEQLRDGGHLLLLDLEGEQQRPLTALEQEQAVADRADGPDGQPLDAEVVALAHDTERSASDAVELTVRTWVPEPPAASSTETEQGETVRRWKRSRWIPAALAIAALIGSAWETATTVSPRCRATRRASAAAMRVCISRKDSPPGNRKALGERCTWLHSGLAASTFSLTPVHSPKSHSSSPRSFRTRSPRRLAIGRAVSAVRSSGDA